jgi:hypothetical protein
MTINASRYFEGCWSRRYGRIRISSALYLDRGNLSVADALALRTTLAYPASKTIFLKMYSVSDDVLAVYPNLKSLISTICQFGFFRSFFERQLFGDTDTCMPLHVFRIVIALGRQEIDELTASRLLKRFYQSQK